MPGQALDWVLQTRHSLLIIYTSLQRIAAGAWTSFQQDRSEEG